MRNTIILIDDDQDHLDLLKLAFKQVDKNLSCISFIYPDDALKALSNFAELPKCIMIDFNLPRKEGIECLYEIRKIRKYDQVPIAMYAKNASPVIIEALQDAGANFVFEKPAKLTSYKSILSQILGDDRNNTRLLGYDNK